MHPELTSKDPEALAPATGPMRLISSLRHRDWRLLWIGLVANQTGEWMDNLAISWLVLVTTNSPQALGTVSLMRGIPTIGFSLVGGVVADRVDRRTLMLCTRLGGMLTTAMLAALATTGALDFWLIAALVFLRGTVAAFDSPARASVVGDLVPRSDLTNAMALHSANFNVTRLFGPAIGGLLIGVIGSAGVLWINVASYAVTVGCLLAMGTPPGGKSQGASPWDTFTEGIRYVGQTPVVLMLLLLSIVPFFLGQPYQSMMPVFAKDVLFVGPQGLGLLTTAAAADSVIGAFITAGFGGVQRKGMVMMLGCTAYALFIAAFAASPWAPISAALLFMVGASNQVYQTINGTLIQLIVPSEYRGRVMGIHQLDRGFIPVGAFVAGSLAEWGGAPFATGLMGCLLAAFCLSVPVLVFVPRMRELR